MLLIGPSGCGKTTLAEALTREYGTICHKILGKVATPHQICERALRLETFDFLFVDEAHRLRDISQEVFYELTDSEHLTDWPLTDWLEPGSEAQAKAKDRRDEAGKLLVHPFTLILATDQPAKLLKALYRRMEKIVALDSYTEEELIEIAKKVAEKLDLTPTARALRKVVSACQGLPCNVKTILGNLQLYYHADSLRDLTEPDVQHYLDADGRSPEGLDDRQQHYLWLLHELGTASLGTLASLLGTDPEDVHTHIEPELLRLRFVIRRQDGRTLTPNGMAWTQTHAQEKQNPDQENNDDEHAG
jgi:Holliday junction resolvasome RuvABC ATP-dependent DNA helicase subunit